MKPKRLTALAIGAKLRARQPFSVASEAQRKAVLLAAKHCGVQIITRADEANGGFKIQFVAI